MAMRKTRAVTESKMLSHLRLLSVRVVKGGLPLGSLTADIKQLVGQFADLKVGFPIISAEQDRGRT
jgi:hypothetical protein